MKIFFLLSCIALVLATNSCQRVCNSNAALCNTPNAPGSYVPFTCQGPNCVNNQRPGTSRYLNCPTKVVLPALDRDSTDGCSSPGDHVMWVLPEFISVFKTQTWIMKTTNGVSNGVWNEFDDDGNGDFDRAEMSGFLQPTSNDPNAATFEVRMFLKKTATPNSADIKKELSCSNPALSTQHVNEWYYFGLDPAKPSVLIGTGLWAGLTITLGFPGNMKVQVGPGGSMKNNLFGASIWIGFASFSYDAQWGTKPRIENQCGNLNQMHHGDFNIRLDCTCQCPDSPPPPVCGNGVVENGEQCDGGACCKSDCTFKPVNTVCRESAGECDVAEVCSGSASTCPSDKYKGSNVPCLESFGVCEVKVPAFCPGNAPKCSNLPIVDFHQNPILLELYNVISFGSFKANTGDVEGRVFVRNNFNAGAGFSIGYETRNQGPGSDFSPYALMVGRDATWISGALFPDGSGVPYPDTLPEEIFIGGVNNLPSYMQPQISGGPCQFPGCLDSDFDSAQNYYSFLQTVMAQMTPNVRYTVSDSALQLECLDRDAATYVVNVAEADINKVTWWNTKIGTCRLNRNWIFNIQGLGDITLRGDPVLPTISERTVINVLNWNRKINVETEVRGNILAPKNSLSQTGGVIKGKVIVADVPFMLQINRPNCFSYIPIKITDFVVDTCAPGSDNVKVRNGGSFAVGDEFEFENSPGVKRTIKKKTENSDGTCNIQFTPPNGVIVPTNLRAVAFVNANAVTDERTDAAQGSPASAFVVSFALIFAALFALMA